MLVCMYTCMHAVYCTMLYTHSALFLLTLKGQFKLKLFSQQLIVVAITHAILRNQCTVTMHSFAKLESLVVSNMPTLNSMNERQIDRFYRILSYFQGRSIILAMDYYMAYFEGRL